MAFDWPQNQVASVAWKKEGGEGWQELDLKHPYASGRME